MYGKEDECWKYIFGKKWDIPIFKWDRYYLLDFIIGQEDDRNLILGVNTYRTFREFRTII